MRVISRYRKDIQERMSRRAEIRAKHRPVRATGGSEMSKCDDQVNEIPPPADEIARKVDELWPEIEASIEYLRTR